MKLYAKFFLCATLVISAALLLAGYLLITISHENALNREIDRALNQHQYDKFTIQASLIDNPERMSEDNNKLQEVMDHLSEPNTLVSRDGTTLYSGLPEHIDISLLEKTSDNTALYQFQTVEDKTYIVVCGRLTQDEVTLSLLAATDISAVAAQREQMTREFAPVYFITLGISMGIVLILSRLMIKPIQQMRGASARIARGNYRERLTVSSADEIGQMSESFNLMADAIESKMEELIESARQKEEFAANFAHELKTPLTSVIGYADMLYQKSLTPERAKEAAWYILSEGLRLEALSLKLLDLIVLNKKEFILESVSADELFDNVAGGMAPVLQNEQVSLRLDIQPATVRADYDLVKTLLLNLVDNAIKAGGKHIEMAGKADGERYTVSVSDDGRGIPEKDLRLVTEAFYMVDKSRSRARNGVGLGLALAAKIAEIHGGALAIESSEGVGTVVSFTVHCEGRPDDD